MRGKLGILTACAAVLACAHAQSTQQAKESFSFNSNAGAYTVTVTPSQMTGPQYLVSRSPGELRGQVWNSPVKMQWTQDQVTGSVGGQPVNLRLVPTGKATRIQGLYGGVLSNLEVGPDTIQGRMGKCSYSMRRAGDYYSGQSQCDGAPLQPTSIQLPQGYDNAPTGEQAAALSLLLGR